MEGVNPKKTVMMQLDDFIADATLHRNKCLELDNLLLVEYWHGKIVAYTHAKIMIERGC